MERLSKMLGKARGLTPRELVAEAATRARRRIGRAIDRAGADPARSFVTDEELDRSLSGEFTSEIAARVRERDKPRLTVGLADLDRTTEVIKEFFPESVEETRREADEILLHRITVFGRVFDLGPQIDWHADPATGVSWPLDYFTEVPIRQGNGSDVRSVWELNRLHHFVTLGRAYALTQDEKYAEEFLIQLASWYEENPPRFGVNWKVPMEAAIRAVNLIAATDLLRASPLMTDDLVELYLKALLSHGRFIRANLEFSHSLSSNHYLSNLIGLFAIGMTLPDLKESSSWVGFSAPRLLEEMERQILGDGVDYEGSTAYHRLVLEIYSLFFALSHATGVELPPEHWERLEAMFVFASHYLKPDGTAPLIGDSDDGRLLRFKQRPAIDHSYLMPLAAVLLESELFKQSSRIDEEAIWWFGEAGREVFEGLQIHGEVPRSHPFKEAQIFVQRAGPLYAIVDCGDHGVRGHGSHAHSDALSFELFAFDRTFLRDPGTFVYTASPRWRNLFRSTAYHNTVRVDRRDISLVSEDYPFALGPNVRPEVFVWESTDELDRLEAAHYGYTNLAGPVVHRRVMIFDKREGYWIVEDIFTGEGRHLLEFFYNFDAGLDMKVEEGGRAIASGEAAALAIVPASGHEFETEATTRWVSLDYGTRLRSSGIIYRLSTELPFENIMLLVPYRLGDEEKVNRIQDSGFRIQGLFPPES